MRKTPDQVGKQAKAAVEAILKARVEIRHLAEMLQDIKEDASGILYTNNYNNPSVTELRDKLNNMDRDIGPLYREVEFFVRSELPGITKKASYQYQR